MTELQAGSVTVADLYRELVGMRSDVSKALLRIELAESQDQVLKTTVADHETRIRGIEGFRWKMTGVAIILPAIIGFITAYLPAHIK